MSDANRDQIAYWNGEVGQRWARHQHVLDAVFAPLTEALFEAAPLARGEHVLDIGCGAGETALLAARRLGAGGRVTAVDISGPMLTLARERAVREAVGTAAVTWIEADAQTYDFGAGVYDGALSRFGVMFFADPVAAFANIRRSLRPGADLTFLCWRGIPDNPWVSVPRAVALRFVPDFEPPPPDAPGPFRFADPALLVPILQAAGFERIAYTPLDRIVTLGRAPDAAGAASAAADVAVDLGPVARLLRERAPDLREAAREAIVGAFLPLVENGRVGLGAGCWLVSAA